MNMRAAAIVLGLGLAAGAVLPGNSAGQIVPDTTVQPAPPEAERQDTVPAPRDTMMAPISRADLPGTVGVSEPNRWHRPQFVGTGSLSLLDLIERIPGVTSFHTGWIASPMHAAHLGNAARVRVFLDGVELVPMDPRIGLVSELHDVPLWALEEVSIERGADEVRVHARTWRADRTTTYTRTDFETGDLNTTLYRAFAGRRWRGGAAVQGAIEQYATSAPAGRGGGDQFTLFARGGWARGHWSADATVLDARRTRDAHPRLIGTGAMPRFRANRRTAYARVGYGDPERGGWAQLLAVTRSFRPEAQVQTGQDPVPDTTRWDSQYIAAAGLTVGPLRLSATNRLHVLDSEAVNAVEGRALAGAGPLSASLRTERRTGGLSSVEEATVMLAPLSFLALTAAAARRTAGVDAVEEGSLVTARVEGHLRLGGVWLSAGAVRRGETPVPGLAVFDTLYVSAVDPEATGIIAGARGRIWREVGASVWLVRWEEAGWYRPQLQVRSELFVRTMWLSRFPRGNLEIYAGLTHDHRSEVFIARTDGGDLFLGADVTPQVDLLTTRIEVRLLDAVVFWQQRLFVSEFPQFVPGYVPLQAASLFGLRWNFWN